MTKYILEYHPASGNKPMAIWRDKPADGNLVADLRVGATMEEAQIMVDALNKLEDKA